MGVTELGGNPYLNLFISGIMECCCALFACLTLDRIGRRIFLSLILFVCGISCLICGLLPPGNLYCSHIICYIGTIVMVTRQLFYHTLSEGSSNGGSGFVLAKDS